MTRLVLPLLALAVFLSSPKPKPQGETVPFVGCRVDGMPGVSEPPQGAARIVALNRSLAQAIAFYSGEGVPGVFAPRGWHCQGWTGSAASTLIVVPASIDTAPFPPRGIHGPAVEIKVFSGGTSGRFDVAIYASRLFPRTASKFIDRVKSESLEPAEDFERGPYPNDIVRYPSNVMAEFTTPAHKTGLGTAGILAPSRDPIVGIAVLDTSGDWSLWVLRVRVPSNLRPVAPALLGLNRHCMKRIDVC